MEFSHQLDFETEDELVEHATEYHNRCIPWDRAFRTAKITLPVRLVEARSIL